MSGSKAFFRADFDKWCEEYLDAQYCACVPDFVGYYRKQPVERFLAMRDSLHRLMVIEKLMYGSKYDDNGPFTLRLYNLVREMIDFERDSELSHNNWRDIEWAPNTSPNSDSTPPSD